MRTLLIMMSVTLLTGCGTTFNSTPAGYLPGDPCVRCGEGWTFIEPGTVPLSSAELSRHGIQK